MKTYNQSNTARGEFTHLDGLRQGLKTRLEKYANFTLPRLFPPENYQANNDELNHDWQSVGAQVTNHLVNKLMLTMFAPSRPFMRLEAGDGVVAKMQAAGVKIEQRDIEIMLAAGERKAARAMDKLPIRTALFEVLARLVVLGDSLIHDEGDAWVVIPFRDYVLRRTATGRVASAVIREKIYFADLDEAVQAEYRKHNSAIKEDSEVCLYRWVKRVKGARYKETSWIEDMEIQASEFSGEYPEKESPWGFFTWHLTKGQHYGTGHVEDYSGDFSGLSSLSESQVKGAILASEFRWLVNPGGQTQIEDLQDSENGACLPGVAGDVELVANSKPGDLNVVRTIGEDYIRRLGQGFLLSSAMTRDAERVTAEEIRLQAVELETGLGGVYTRLAGTLQMFVAHRLLAAVDLKVDGTQIELSIITGLDALSRNGDLSMLRAALADLGALQQLGPMAARLKLAEVTAAIFLGHGLDPNKYLKTDEEVAQEQAQAQEAQAQQVAAESAAQAVAQQQAQA